MPETAHSRLPRHCAVCGVDWPDGHQGVCRSCGAGLSCRADTTDSMAPDPPCAGSRHRLPPQNTDDVMTMLGWTKRVEPGYVVIDETWESERAPSDSNATDDKRTIRPETST